MQLKQHLLLQPLGKLIYHIDVHCNLHSFSVNLGRIYAKILQTTLRAIDKVFHTNIRT